MKLILSLMLLVIIIPVSADDHSDFLNLEKRQGDSTFRVTSIHFGDELTTITATGDMGEYGKVYASFDLSYEGSNRSFGQVTGQGRGVSGGEMIAGEFAGRWFRNGDIVVMRHVVQLSDGSQNLDVVTLRVADNEMDVEVYVLK